MGTAFIDRPDPTLGFQRSEVRQDGVVSHLRFPTIVEFLLHLDDAGVLEIPEDTHDLHFAVAGRRLHRPSVVIN